MARLLVKSQQVGPAEIRLTPGCNRVGREGDVEIVVAHPSVSRQHCEVWLTDEAVLVRDLGSRNGTYIDGSAVQEGQLFTGQTLRLGDIEMVLAEAPARISVPELPHAEVKSATFLPDGTPACFIHEGLGAEFQCTKCHNSFCATCIRELRLSGGTPRRFCPNCGGPCERILHAAQETKRSSWLNKIVDAFTRPSRRP